MDGPIMAEKPTNLFLLDNASSDKGPKLLRNSAKVGAVQFGDLSAGDITRTYQMQFSPFQHLRTHFSIWGSYLALAAVMSHLTNAMIPYSASEDTYLKNKGVLQLGILAFFSLSLL